ncbi:hypothetical protein L596_029200 [Steinernema carpocapsae]|uniref:Peptidase A1 domain-containing protein n=1 Tax=Steinernema carpocapsae TaxID=34508 RepID=A0A4U5LTY5_STECR|nr:hypothetical protein L596_029200 [Steinernema carpocapsae]
MKNGCLLLLLICFGFALGIPPKTINFVRRYGRDYVINKSPNGHYLHRYNDVYMEGFMIGSQDTLAFFILDTTSVALTVALCPENPADAQTPLNCYDPKASSTFVRTSNTTGIDLMMPFALTYVNMTQEFELIPYGSVNKFMNGVVGMNFPAADPTVKAPFSTHMLSFFDANMFSLAFSPFGCQGFLRFGDLLPYDTCLNAKLHSVPVTSEKNWQFAISGFQFGPVHKYAKMQAIVVSSSGYIGIPGRYLEKMMLMLDISWNATVGAYVTACDRANLPKFTVMLPGAVTLTIESQQYINKQEPLDPYESNRCVMNFEDSSKTEYGADWYFGHPLLAYYCVNFDFDKKTMGFAPNVATSDFSCDP